MSWISMLESQQRFIESCNKALEEVNDFINSVNNEDSKPEVVVEEEPKVERIVYEKPVVYENPDSYRKNKQDVVIDIPVIEMEEPSVKEKKQVKAIRIPVINFDAPLHMDKKQDVIIDIPVIEMEEPSITPEEVITKDTIKVNGNDPKEIAKAVQDAVVEALRQVPDNISEANVEVNVNGHANKLVRPITFTGTINPDGSVAGEEYNVYVPQQQQFVPAGPIALTQWVDNSVITKRHSSLVAIERAIREEPGFDCVITQQLSSGIYDVAVYYNNMFMEAYSFHVDIQGLVHDKTPKWIICWYPQTKPLEMFPCLLVGRTDLIKKYITGQLTKEEVLENKIYSDDYVLAAGFVDLNTIPDSLSYDTRTKVIHRLANAMPVVVQGLSKVPTTKFKIENWASFISFQLVSNDIRLKVKKDTIDVM